MTVIQELSSPPAANAEIQVNENFETLSAAGIFAKKHSTITGLTWGYYGGRYNGNTIADNTVSLTDDATNYVVVLRSTGVVSVSTNDTNATNSLYARLYKLTTVDGVVTAELDERWEANGLFFAPGAVSAEGVAITDSGAYFTADDVEGALQEVGAALAAISGGGPSPAFRYTVDLDSTADSDPTSGLVKFNHATIASATKIFFDDLTNDGVDLSTHLAALGATGFVRLQSADDEGEWAIFKWTAITDDTGYFDITVQHHAGLGTFEDGDEVLVVFDSDANSGAGGSDGVVQGRLTLASGVPVPTSNQTGKTTIYFTPYKGNKITLWDGAAWTTYTFTQTSHALGTMTASICYDVFGYVSGGSLALEKLAWTSATVRATDITIQDGRYCKDGDKTRLYLGTFYALTTTTTEDSHVGGDANGGRRFLWNYYNRVERPMKVVEATSSWSYTTNTWRQANGAAANKVELVVGVPEDAIRAQLLAAAYLASNTRTAIVSIGHSSTSTPSSFMGLGYNNSATAKWDPMMVPFVQDANAGYQYLAWMERGADSTCSFGGTNSGTSQTGLSAAIMA